MILSPEEIQGNEDTVFRDYGELNMNSRGPYVKQFLKA